MQIIQMEVFAMATETLARDAAALERSLAGPGDEIAVSLSRETAEFVSRVVKAKANGRGVIVTRGFDEVTPSEAASLLGMSRPQVCKLMERGDLPFRKVGSHHRILVSDIEAFHDAERKRRRAAMARFTELENDLGLTE
jgi:excisionase family DNA binding protein